MCPTFSESLCSSETGEVCVGTLLCSEFMLPKFMYAHKGCHLSIESEHDEPEERYTEWDLNNLWFNSKNHGMCCNTLNVTIHIRDYNLDGHMYQGRICYKDFYDWEVEEDGEEVIIQDGSKDDIISKLNEYINKKQGLNFVELCDHSER